MWPFDEYKKISQPHHAQWQTLLSPTYIPPDRFYQLSNSVITSNVLCILWPLEMWLLALDLSYFYAELHTQASFTGLEPVSQWLIECGVTKSSPLTHRETNRYNLYSGSLCSIRWNVRLLLNSHSSLVSYYLYFAPSIYLLVSQEALL